MPLTWQREVEGWKWSHCISIEQAWLAGRAVWLEPGGGKGSAEETRGRGSTILGALHRTVGWGQSAKPSSHPSIIKSVTVNIFWHERLSTLITTEDPHNRHQRGEIKLLVWHTVSYTYALICTPVLRNVRVCVCVCIHEPETLLYMYPSAFLFSKGVCTASSPLLFMERMAFHQSCGPLCQIRLRAAYSLLTGAACSNDP